MALREQTLSSGGYSAVIHWIAVHAMEPIYWELKISSSYRVNWRFVVNTGPQYPSGVAGRSPYGLSSRRIQTGAFCTILIA